MRCCEIVPSLEEKQGGPSKSTYAISVALAQLGHDVTLLATHPSTPETRELERLHVSVSRRSWPQFLCPSPGLRQQLRTVAADVVHHHSIWLRTLCYAHRHAVAQRAPLVISPRGMMSSWAWQHHHWRKQLTSRLVHPGAFQAAAGWHATSEEEAQDIRALGFTQPVCVAPNGVDAPLEAERRAAVEFWQNACPDIARRRTALFYSRFHQKKRVIELIDLWLQRAPKDWLLLMIGLPDDYTTTQLDTYVLRSSGGGRVRVYDGEGRPPPYAAASIFLLPSHSENFGLAIAEAMANGLPVVVTDATPWRAVNGNGAGWCVPWEEYGTALQDALAESESSLTERGRVAREYSLAGFSWEQSARKLAEFYQQLRTLHA